MEITARDWEDAVTVCQECVYGLPESAQKREALQAAKNLVRVADLWRGAAPETKTGGIEVLIAEEKTRIIRFIERFVESRTHERDIDEAFDELLHWLRNDRHRVEL